MKKFTIILPAILLTLSANAQETANYLDKIESQGNFAPMFAFQPTHDAPDNLTNVATWKGSANCEAGAQGFIKAEGDHFIDGNGTIRRFLGTNICFTGCFPTKEDAEKVAAELRRYGINLVRLHYVHHKFPENKIYPEKDSFLEPEQLDRFDYLFAQLKKHGIYTYFQLNIARKFGEENGIVNAKKLPLYNNGIDNIDARMIELQKKYHKEILCHVNPYTGLEYRNEPAIAMLELANENSILYSWFSTKHKIDHLTEPYASAIKKDWNEFLANKYGSDEKLKNSWLSSLKGTGEEYMPDGTMAAIPEGLWDLQNDKFSKSTFSFKKAGKKDKLKGKYYVSVNVQSKGANLNIPQLYRKELKLKDGEPLCLRFKIRSDVAREIRVRISQNHAPWSVCGLYNKISCSEEWKEYALNFCSSMTDDNLRLVFSDFAPGTYDIADLSLTSGIEYKWDSARSLKNGNIDWPYLATWGELPQQCEDFIEFLSKYELDYFDGLYRNIKENVHPMQAVTGTQLMFGQDLPQAKMDYCDMHNYWCHPAFPGRPWDQKNWYLLNKALVNGESFPCSSLAMLSRNRILGKPLTISEYDHPNLNFYSAEGNVLITAMGAFQDWSAIIQFAWTHDTRFFRTTQQQTFDMCSATQKLVHFPACYAMFVRGDIKKGDQSVMYTTQFSQDRESREIAMQKTIKAPARESNQNLAASALSLVSGKQIEELPELFSEEGRKVIHKPEELPSEIKKAYQDKEMKSGTGELLWNWQVDKSAYFTADSPLTKAFTGFVCGRSFRFDGITLKPGKTRLDWITFTMTNTTPGTQDESGRLQKGKYLIAATGMCHNTNAVFVDLGANKLSCAKNNGGDAGTGPILCEGVPAEITLCGLAGNVKCYALDPAGNRKTAVEIRNDSEGNAIVVISPKYKTVWYEMIVE